MALSDNEKFDLEGIQRTFNIKQKSIDNLQIEKAELEKIWSDFKQSSIERLEPVRVEILSILNENLAEPMNKEQEAVFFKYLKHIYYHLKYRNVDKQNLEIMLYSFETGRFIA